MLAKVLMQNKKQKNKKKYKSSMCIILNMRVVQQQKQYKKEMKNIKVCFHHPNYLHPFKLDLYLHDTGRMFTQEAILSGFSEIRGNILVSGEEGAMLDALSLPFKGNFLHKYHQAIQERSTIDFLGQTHSKHKQMWMSKLSNPTTSHLKQFYLYIKRALTYKLPHIALLYAEEAFLTMLTQMHIRDDLTLVQMYQYGYYLLYVMITILKEGQLKCSLELLVGISEWVFMLMDKLSSRYQHTHLTEIYLRGLSILNHIYQWASAHLLSDYIYHKLNTHKNTLKHIISFLHSQNGMVVGEALTYILNILHNCQNMSQLLLFITECINAGISDAIQHVYESFKYRRYKSSQSVCMLVIEEQYYSGHMRKTQLKEKKQGESNWEKQMKKHYKLILQLKQNFSEYRTGRVQLPNMPKTTPSTQKVELQTQQNMLEQLNQLHNKYLQQSSQKTQKIKAQLEEEYQKKMSDLKKEIVEAVKMNEWYVEQMNKKDSKIKELEGIVSQFVDVRKKFRERRDVGIKRAVNVIVIPDKKGQQIKSGEKEKKVQTPTKKEQKPLQTSQLPTLPPPIPSTSKLPEPPLPPPPPILSTLKLPEPPLPPPPPLTLTPTFTLQTPPQRNSGRNQNSPQKQMKIITWNVVELAKIKDSFWDGIEELQFDENQVMKYFSRNVKKKEFNLEQKIKKEPVKTLLKQDRAKNIEIVLRKTKIPVNKLNQIFFEIDHEILTPQNIVSLLKILPTSLQHEQYINQEPLTEEWTISDHFLYNVVRIKNFGEILTALEFKNDYSEYSARYFLNINRFLQFFTDLRYDEFLQLFLQHLLSVGNFMNSNTNRGNAYGVKLNTLPKLYDFDSIDQQFSLFEYIVKIMTQKAKTPPTRYFDNTIVLPLDVLKQDIAQFKKNINLVQECILMSTEQPSLSEEFLTFYIQCREEISLMEVKLEECKRIYQDVLQFYCEKLESQSIVEIVKEWKSKLKAVLNRQKRSNKII